MSFKTMAWAYETKEVGGITKLVLIGLANHASERNDNACWISRQALADELGIGISTVKRSISELAEKSLLSVEQRFREDGSQTTNMIYLNIEQHGVHKGPPRGPHGTTPRSTQDHHEPVSEPVSEPRKDSCSLVPFSNGQAQPINGSSAIDDTYWRNPPSAAGDPIPQRTITTSQSNHETRRRAATQSLAVKVVETCFELFYEAYPRHVGRKAAEKAYAKALKDGANPRDIMQGAYRFSDLVQRNGTETQFIPHPATWLNRGSWEDDFETEERRPTSYQPWRPSMI